MSERGRGERSPREGGAPHGITLFDHAQISAEIAEGDRPYTEVLKAHDLTEEQWNESTLHWMKRLGDDAMANGERARIPLVYSDAFAKAQDARKPVPAMEVEGYAELVFAIQTAGAPDRPLAERALSQADYLRLSRYFAGAMAAEPALAQRYFERLQALGPPDA